MLSLDPADQNVRIGNMATVSLNISGLGSGTAPSLGGFMLGINYNPSIVVFDSLAFGPYLGDPTLGDAAVSFDATTAGVVKLDEVSFLSTQALDDLQGSNFMLATLIFKGLDAGTSSLLLTDVDLGDAGGVPLPYEGLENGQITVTQGPVVPEPATVSLLGLGIVGFLWHARKQRKAE